MKRIASLLALILCSTLALALKPTRITVSISPAKARLYSGTTKQFTANRQRYIQERSHLVSHRAAPTVTATKTAYVTATSVADTTKKASATVTVNLPPPTLTQIALSPSSVSINIGSQEQLTATAYGPSFGALPEPPKMTLVRYSSR